MTILNTSLSLSVLSSIGVLMERGYAAFKPRESV